MNVILIFVWVWAAFIAMAFWESSVEGRKAWGKGKFGWRIKLTKNNTMTRYHFWILIMWWLLLSLPFIIYSWNFKLFGILVSAYFSGIVIEDFFWFVVNPKVSFKKDFNPKFANYYPWFKIGKINIPVYYIIDLGIAFLSWLLIWR